MPVTDQAVLSSLACNILHLILMPTEACNFRCIYCYEDFQYNRMPKEVRDGVKALLTRRAPSLSLLDLSWFGGEPLLALDIVQDVLEHASRLREDHELLAVRSDMTTNAFLLTGPVFTRLLNLGVSKYQIALDGPREWHDRKRLRANGKATFDRIWGNLLDMRSASMPFAVNLRLQVDRENYEAMPGLIDEFRASFGQDERFNLFFRPLARWGSSNDARLAVLEEDERTNCIAKLEGYAVARGVACSSPSSESSVCYAAKANSFIVRANGRLNKCTLALEHPANQVGRLHADGRVEIATDRVQGWIRGLWSQNPRELSCPMLGHADVTLPPVEVESGDAVPH